jgi:hypothetical protein
MASPDISPSPSLIKSHHTAESLEALPDMELHAVVSKVVFKADATENAEACYHLPVYPATYRGMGMVVKRMRKLGFTYALYSDGMLSCPGYAWTENFPRARFFKEGEFMAERVAEANAETLPRAVAIAAILAVQSSKEQPQ